MLLAVHPVKGIHCWERGSVVKLWKRLTSVGEERNIEINGWKKQVTRLVHGPFLFVKEFAFNSLGYTLFIFYKGHHEIDHMVSLNFLQNFHRSVPYLSLIFSPWMSGFWSNSYWYYRFSMWLFRLCWILNRSHTEKIRLVLDLSLIFGSFHMLCPLFFLKSLICPL